MIHPWTPWGLRARLAWHHTASAGLRLRHAAASPHFQTYTGALAFRNRKMLAALARPMDRYTVVETRRLDPESDHATFNLVFEGRGHPEVRPGDMAYLSWRNPPEAVAQLLGLYGEPGDRRVTTTAFSSPYIPGRPESMTLAEALSRRVDLHEASEKLVRRVGLGAFVDHNKEQDKRHHQFHKDAAKDGGLLVTHPHFDYRKVHLPAILPSLKAHGVPLAEIVRSQDRISARPYTLAGFWQRGERFRFEITVSQVTKPIFTNATQTVKVEARASQFFQGLRPGDEVEGWLLPEVHPFPSALGRRVPLVMVTTGSGVSSLLSLLRSEDDVGPVWAIHGVRSWATKHLYGPELQGHLASGRLARLDVAASRPVEGEGPARRVQAVLWEHRREVAEQIRLGAHFYLCGRLSMGTEVAQVIEKILIDQGLAPDQAEARATLVDWHLNLRFQASVSGV